MDLHVKFLVFLLTLISMSFLVYVYLIGEGTKAE